MNWSADALYAKAKLFMTRAFFDVGREDAQFPFWCSLGLELLGRAVVAHTHPVLLADPSEPENLFYAFGYEVTAPKSVSTKAVFARCRRLVPDFTETEREACMALMYLRNEDLHTGGLPFEALSTAVWLPAFFRSCRILLQTLGRDLTDLIGDEEALAAERLLVQADKTIQAEVQKRIGQAKKAFAAFPLGEQEQRRNALARRILRNPGAFKVVTCPACAAEAEVSGEEIRRTEPRLEDEMVVVEHIILATKFECLSCGLALAGHEELNAAGIGGQFSVVDSSDPLDFYGEAFAEGYFDEEYTNE